MVTGPHGTGGDLAAFIARLDTAGELCRIEAIVDPILEIAAITDRVCKRPGGGTALLFEHPAGSDFKVATNLFGSTGRLCRALGIDDLNELTRRLTLLLSHLPAAEFASFDRDLGRLPIFSRFAPHACNEPEGDLQQMVPPDLTRIPFLQSWPDDGSGDGFPRYLTLPQVYTVDPEGGTANCGMYRVQLRGGHGAAIQWKTGSGGARHAEQYRRAGKKMPVAIVLGGAPAALFSALFPLPGALDELTFAGFLGGSPLTTVPCRSVPLRVPRGAEIVIEGYVDPARLVSEGPFGNHTGFYSAAAPAPLLEVTAICHRPDAVIPATIVGPPPMEDCWMAQVWERLLLAFLHKLLPEIADIHFPPEWIFHQSAIISLENPRPAMVRNCAGELWRLPWFASARLLVFIDAGTGPATLHHAAWRTINLTDAATDMFSDPTTGRRAMDGTGCRFPRRELHRGSEITSRITSRWKEYQIP